MTGSFPGGKSLFMVENRVLGLEEPEYIMPKYKLSYFNENKRTLKAIANITITITITICVHIKTLVCLSDAILDNIRECIIRHTHTCILNFKDNNYKIIIIIITPLNPALSKAHGQNPQTQREETLRRNTEKRGPSWGWLAV